MQDEGLLDESMAEAGVNEHLFLRTQEAPLAVYEGFDNMRSQGNPC